MLSFCSIEFTGLLVKGTSLFIFCWQNLFLTFYYENFQSHKCRENSSMSLHIYTVIDYWFVKTWRHFGIILTLQSTNSMWIQIFFLLISLFIFMTFVFKSILSAVSIAISNLLSFLFARNIFFHPLFSIYMCLSP